MPDPAELSLTTAVTLVLGGIAAFILALVLALGGYGRPRSPRATAAPALPAPSVLASASGEAQPQEFELPVDTSDQTDTGTR